MKKIIILLGIPGSGKGTQARLLAQRNGYVHISTGDLLRQLAQNASADPSDVRKLADMKSGKLVADDLIYKLAFSAIRSALAAGQGVILDGAIRSVEQAQAFDDFFKGNDMQSEVMVIEITLSDETAYKRLTKRKVCVSCGHIIPYSPDNERLTTCSECGGQLQVRADDTPDTIEKRIAEQGNSMLAPIVSYYQAAGVLRQVDGERQISEVDEKVMTAIQ
ncbi:MAG: adenylate kinase [Candidatus Magasanikbacteria bacterium CG10_big_fil_rev_8_21_14_0_10_47_10]|uniref:Adenylate kinase n=1 Tax=Candidatus Magasanikbacteria bacterium CG10_big_fil_rev_8_21_14_0_10_47_10 TaxID=1974652 RepID=A0A2H0TR73_9BACT|nr:MAG: adenylate kinase [Candidatus Magasanikbacteria bacterium CG10_big_fil_rev_8_21_14_0_10_47_10]